jgi:hypothetical protein
MVKPMEALMDGFDLTGFEEFDRRGVPVGAKPFVTVQKKGTLSLNRAAFEALGSPKMVVLLYNPERKIIALRPSDEDNPRAYPVRRLGERGNTYIVAGTAFTAHYEIPTEPARRFQATKADGNILLIDLTSDSTVVTGPRGRTTEAPRRESVATSR